MKAFFLFISLTFLCAFSQKPAYTIFNKNGKKTSFTELLQAATKADIVLFGEVHNISMAHWLELQLEKELSVLRKGDLILGAEMLEADDQIIVDEYLHKLFE